MKYEEKIYRPQMGWRRIRYVKKSHNKTKQNKIAAAKVGVFTLREMESTKLCMVHSDFKIQNNNITCTFYKYRVASRTMTPPNSPTSKLHNTHVYINHININFGISFMRCVGYYDSVEFEL